MSDRSSWTSKIPFASRRKVEQKDAEIQQLQFRLSQQQQQQAQLETQRRDSERLLQLQLDREQQERARQEFEREERELALQRQLQREQDDRARQEFERMEAQRLEWERKERLKRERKERDQRKRDTERMKLQMVSPDTLRNLRELIRERYELDVEIWSLRNVRRPDRWIVEEKMEKADAVLLKIFTIVHAWETTQGSWTDAEWKQAKEIQNRVLAEGKRWWTGNPPWEDY
jgi:hypothetical protein